METKPVSRHEHRNIGVRLAAVGLAAGLIGSGVAIPALAGAATSHKHHQPKFVIFSDVQPGLGTILETQTGYPLYTNVSDTQVSSSVATQPFAAAWPPVLVPPGDVLFAGRGIVGLGTMTLPSGQVQVTWQGLPLYTFIKDTTPNVVTGNGVRGFEVAFVALQKKK
jgi:predicted lipoprotein with Yx(FWY)xxD motif